MCIFYLLEHVCVFFSILPVCIYQVLLCAKMSLSHLFSVYLVLAYQEYTFANSGCWCIRIRPNIFPISKQSNSTMFSPQECAMILVWCQTVCWFLRLMEYQAILVGEPHEIGVCMNPSFFS